MKKNVVLTLLSFLTLSLASCQMSSNASPKRKKSSLISSLTTLTSSTLTSDEEEHEDPYDPGEIDPDDPVNPVDPDPDDPDEDPAITQYYASISSTATGKDLKSALYGLIKVTKTYVTYDQLYDVYREADVREDGKHLWDIYSDTTMYTLYDNRISGNYSKEGDALNREHMIPQSLFSEKLPMKADPHHVLPSDGFVNGKRSNYPHGNVTSSPTYTSNDGCKLGKGTGNTTVFEPMAHYKGDIARIYFYFVTCYQDKLSSLEGGFDAFTYDSYPSIDTEFLEVYLRWHLEDPVSEKEIVRNREIQEFQPNRNPFIDRPQYACRIWGGTNSTTKALCGM